MSDDRKEIVSALRNLDNVIQTNLKRFDDKVPQDIVVSSNNVKERPDLVDVFIRVVFLKVGEVNTIAEKFSADVFVQARWRESKLDNNGTTDGDLTSWKNFWNPNLFVENALGELKEDIWYTVSYNDLGEAFIYEKRRVKGTFFEQMELVDYPFDTQDLTITMSTDRGETEVRMVEDLLEVSSVNVSTFVAEQQWKLHKFVKSCFKVTTNVYKSTKHKHPAISLSCKVTRRFKFFLWNIILIMILLSSLVFTTFTVDVGKVQNRLQLSFILLLSNITFKFTVSQTLPKVSYLTMMDKYIIGSMILLCAVCIWHAVVSQLIGNMETAILADRVALGILGGFYLGFNVTFSVIARMKTTRKLNEYARREEKYVKQMEAVENSYKDRGRKSKVAPKEFENKEEP